ncbi:SusD/RagB family nutrient-binding outer membrane lipoprotein [Wenyingzhuangia sp. chi5]|uniref:SusD/RagB family nutrient-binding outer membrane lipoprotein n=1 Tax=Wenyingzhuangia gilva TaxID=3057677 RepID=A0ABT8VRS4_9FLAO|nr:SusD/RagB family nutrient-binding outer membrane lipoprotein [Wenyingzhuangia sp. chi5]MDO3694662.1 SusD/RagB family nutrient-binding outer membrane lipoprotein [Wenyingzhuangia sp. chi5]
MKKYNKIKSIAAILMVCAYTTSCTDNFDELNTNKNAITEDQLDASLAGPSFASALYAGIHNGSYSSPGVDDQGTWGIATGILSSQFVQYLNTGYSTDRNELSGWSDRGWLRFYTVAVPALNNAFKASEGNAEALAVLKLWKVFMYNQMTDHYGPIPYTEAGNNSEKVAYDSQEAIYEDFFKLLDEADSVLSNTSESTVGLFSISDRVYNGDVEKWKTFGNSLRLRLALRISDVQPAKAKTQAELAVANGVMESNDYSATFKTSNITPNNLNMIVNSWGYVMTAGMESILKGYNDPRLEIWFSETEEEDETERAYRGMPAGGLQDQFGTIQFSKFNDDVLGNDFSEEKPIEILMASECYLNRAEAALNGWNMNGTAQSLYEEGIRLSLSQWGVNDASKISNYIAETSTPVAPDITNNPDYANIGLETPPVSVPVAWANTESEQRTQIAVQKYLALFPESWETWADLRRTDEQIIYPLLNSENFEVGKGLMKRVLFVTNEISTNGEAVDDAIDKLGGPNTGATKLWWDKN